MLAAVGLYGVLSYAVSQRTGEIGIRLALGASVAQVRRMILVQGMRPAIAGIAVGIAVLCSQPAFCAACCSVSRPWTRSPFAAVIVVLLAVVRAGLLVPAIRATRIDPSVALAGIARRAG